MLGRNDKNLRQFTEKQNNRSRLAPAGRSEPGEQQIRPPFRRGLPACREGIAAKFQTGGGMHGDKTPLSAANR